MSQRPPPRRPGGAPRPAPGARAQRPAPAPHATSVEPATAPERLSDADLAALESLLERIPEPAEPLDVMMLDGYLCGVLLQPRPVPEAQWWKHVLDVDGRLVAPGFDTGFLQTLVRRRHAELDAAIAQRQWFDPWVFELEDDEDPLQTVMPWVAGFATAMEFFPALMRSDSPDVAEPLAVLYRSFDPEDLEDADELLGLIEELEPPADLAEAVEALVNSVLLLADVTRPLASTRPAAGRPRPGAGGARRPRR
ncbi:YecA family protein [Ideonella sp.]|uniref:YecA/YgfB family protein n=1 Tax=Ideonella sp. TaxID=1929293 RepID=UPI0035ADCD34